MSRWFIGVMVMLTLSMHGCTVGPLTGDVYSKMKAMSPGERAINYSANKDHYQRNYDLYYNPVDDSLYTKDALGNKQYLLEGNMAAALFLIERSDKGE